MVIILTLYFSSKTTSITLIAYLLLATMPLTTYPPLFLLPIQNKNNIDIDNKNSDVIFNLAIPPNGWDSQQSWRDRYIKQCGITSYQPIAEIDHKPVRDFVAMVNPATTLALLDENLQLQREKDAIEAVALALRDDMQQAREQLEAAEKRNAEQREYYEGVIADGSKRIAELEAREVTLPQRLQPGADGYDDWYVHSADDGEYLKADDVIAAIRAAGIKVKG